jgi:N-acetylneuraminic acid mutarotase
MAFDSQLLNTGGVWDAVGDTWSATSTGANVPAAGLSTAVWAGSEMIVWGGAPTGGRYSPASNTWVPTSVGAFVPTPRSDHTTVWTGAEMIVWGGSGSGYVNTGGRYDPATDAWTPTSTGAGVLPYAPPTPRSGPERG